MDKKKKKITGTLISVLIAAVGVAQCIRGRYILGVLCFVCAIIQYSQVPVDKKK